MNEKRPNCAQSVESVPIHINLDGVALVRRNFEHAGLRPIYSDNMNNAGGRRKTEMLSSTA